MQQSSRAWHAITEMGALIALALTLRAGWFVQSTVEAGMPLTIERAWSFLLDMLLALGQPEKLLVLLGVVSGASIVRMALSYADRSILCYLKEEAGIDKPDLSWVERIVHFPAAVAYRGLSGIATLLGAIAVAVCFKLFDPTQPFETAELTSYVTSIVQGIANGGAQALVVFFLIYGIAATIFGYIASPLVLSIGEMARGHPGSKQEASQGTSLRTPTPPIQSGASHCG
jgi:hypothetical protein